MEFYENNERGWYEGSFFPMVSLPAPMVIGSGYVYAPYIPLEIIDLSITLGIVDDS